MSYIDEAISILHPNHGFSLKNDDYSTIIWQDKPPENPATLEQVNAKITELQNAHQYQSERARSYPSIRDVVVALAEKEEGDDTMWKEITAKRQKVKADNPKPE
mgnify:CR=1 FL=1